jgi:phosphatidylglycerophosphatase A
MHNKLSNIITTFFCIGHCPIAPGTAGSLATIPLAFTASYFGGFYAVAAAATVAYFAGTWATKNILKTSKHDPSFIVIDEVAGQLITFLPVANLLQSNLTSNAIILYIAGFLLFRIFDITKPQPAKYFDTRVINANGVMLDDVVAGIYAAICLTALAFFIA